MLMRTLKKVGEFHEGRVTVEACKVLILTFFSVLNLYRCRCKIIFLMD